MERKFVPVTFQADVEVFTYDGATWADAVAGAEIEIGRLYAKLESMGIHLRVVEPQLWCCECGYDYTDTEEGCDACANLKEVL